MKKLFISQPMRDKSHEEIMAERAKAVEAAEALLGERVEVLDSVLTECSRGPLWCLGRSLCIMAQADVVYFAPGWQDARGCRIEHACAKEYGIERIGA